MCITKAQPRQLNVEDSITGLFIFNNKLVTCQNVSVTGEQKEQLQAKR